MVSNRPSTGAGVSSQAVGSKEGILEGETVGDTVGDTVGVGVAMAAVVGPWVTRPSSQMFTKLGGIKTIHSAGGKVASSSLIRDG